jgi:hypothetical protein
MSSHSQRDSLSMRRTALQRQATTFGKSFSAADYISNGADFLVCRRPDYKKLSVLKNVFPKVPILAVVSRPACRPASSLLMILCRIRRQLCRGK